MMTSFTINLKTTVSGFQTPRLLLLSMTISVSGCANTETKSSVPAAELASRIESGNSPLILDTRSSFEYSSGHIPGALHFPFWQAFFADQQILDRCKTEPVVVYCQHGPRATFAGFALRRLGCRTVLELEGHMAGWSQQQFPVETSSDANTPIQ